MFICGSENKWVEEFGAARAGAFEAKTTEWASVFLGRLTDAAVQQNDATA
jgi:hypothetical protein